MAGQSEGEQQLQIAASQLMSDAPWQAASAGSATEGLTQSLVEALKDATASVNNLATAQEGQPASATGTAESVLTSLVGGQSGLGSAMSTLGGGTDGLLSGGGLLSPIISGIMSLFGSDGPSTPPPLTKFTMPPAIDMDATGGQTTGGQLAGSDYGANGLPRAQTTSQVTVQVNAMDSRSFLDRSNDIASAVRQAILSAHSINDVLSEL
jgi:hypothetical protein